VNSPEIINVTIDQPAIVFVCPFEGKPYYTTTAVTVDKLDDMCNRIASDLNARRARLGAAFLELAEAIDDLELPERQA
jgi:hypothetical protein